MLQSHTKQLQTKYMTILRREIEMRPEDIGAVRLVIGMALSEMQDEHRQQLNEMDDIMADLLQERDLLKVAAGTDAGEILRLQTMEDRLITWVHEHRPMLADLLVDTDTAAVVIDILNTRGGATVAPPTAPIAVNLNGNSNRHVQITDLGTRYTGRRLNVDDTQLRQMAIDKIQLLAARLDRTPTQKDWNLSLGPDEPSLSAVKNRLHTTWNQLIAAAGLTPNDSLVAMRTAKSAAQETTEEEAKAENAEAPFRGQ
jgi:hypothetical protein